jgi:diacylglycerol kinase (ATP)
MDGSVRREVSASEEEAARGRAADAVIIGNPNSGSAGDEGYLERFAETLRAGGLEVEVLNTERPDHATELSAAAGDRIVVAAGGDGTVNEVVNGLSEGATLGILPLGTANVLARELGLPLKPEDACERILTGTPIRMDVGVATDEEGTERRFALMAGIGFDADVVREVTPRLKRYLRSLAFPLVALKVYFRGDRPDLQIVDGDVTHVAQFAVVANGQYYGGEFEVAEDASLTSGALEVVLVEKVGLLMRPDILARILAKSPLDRAMKSFSSQSVVAKSPAARGARVPVQIDGEVWGHLPMSFRIEPAAIKVIR